VPTYQYRCTACGEPLEAVQSFTDDPLTECPSCGGQLRKVFSSVGIVFKGSGFYRTDSREGGDAKKPAAETSKETAAAGTTTDKSSDKPAEKKSDPKSTPAKTDGGDGKGSSTSASSAA